MPYKHAGCGGPLTREPDNSGNYRCGKCRQLVKLGVKGGRSGTGQGYIQKQMTKLRGK